MQLIRLALQNFRQYERTELSFEAGLLAVVGPNGSGKSTLLEAIAWALYGNPAARGTRDTIKRRGSKPRDRVEVTLEFSLGSHVYRLSRTLTNADLSQDGTVIANSASAVTERVRELLGMEREEFFDTYFTGQKELALMGSMTPAERARFLSRVLGYEKLREVQERLRARRSQGRAELTGLERGMTDPAELEGVIAEATGALDAARAAQETARESAVQATTQLSALAPQWAAASERRAAWQGLNGERQVIEAKVLAGRDTLQRRDARLAAAVEARNRLEPLAAALAGFQVLVAERDQLDRAATMVTARSSAVARHEQLVARAADIAA